MRRATEADLPLLVEMAEAFHQEKQHKYAFSAKDTEGFFRSMMENPAGVVLLHGRGFLTALVAGQPSNASYRTAHELFWWSEDNGGRALLDQFEQWAAEMQCNELSTSHPAEEKIVGRYFRQCGYVPETAVLRKELMPCA